MENINNKTDEELEIIKRESAPNSYSLDSIYHKADMEIQRRHRIKIEGLANKTRIGILNQGKNNKFIGNTFVGLDIGIKDEGESTLAQNNKFIPPDYSGNGKVSGYNKSNTKPKQNIWGIITNNLTFSFVAGAFVLACIFYLIYIKTGINLSNFN